MKVRILRQAAEEAEAAAGWYEQERPGLGAEFAEAIEAAIDVIEDGFLPLSPMPRVSGVLGAKRLILRRFPYDIVVVDRGGICSSVSKTWLLARPHKPLTLQAVAATPSAALPGYCSADKGMPERRRRPQLNRSTVNETAQTPRERLTLQAASLKTKSRLRGDVFPL